MTLGLIVGIYAAPVILMLAWLWWEHRKPISDLDRRLDRVDRELDEQQARDAVRVQRTVRAEPIRHTTRGWLS